MKLKEQSKQLNDLINNIPGMADTTVPGVIDDMPEELAEPEPVFTINYDKQMKNAVKKARESLKKMIKSIIPKSFLNDSYVIDKLNQDSNTLGRLYYQLYLIEQVEKANVDSIGNGNVSPRMIEVFNQTAKSHSDIVAQINSLETTLRKSYIDLILDVKNKNEQENTPMLMGSQEPKMIENKEDKFSRVFIGSKNLITQLNDSKKLKLKEKDEIEEL